MNRLMRQNTQTADISSLKEACAYLSMVLDSNADIKDPEWCSAIEEILAFQDEDGSFKLLDSYEVESDVRVDFCHTPTYLCTAILIKAFQTAPTLLGNNWETVLKRALDACSYRGLRGHGYEAFRGEVEALRIFLKADLKEFLGEYPDLSVRFTSMIQMIAEELKDIPTEIAKTAELDRELIDELDAIADASACRVFVYGTLLRGHTNYDYYLAPKMPIVQGYLDGYQMFDIGAFPGIKEGEGSVLGEVYDIDADTLRRLDYLEGEGELYLRRRAKITSFSGKTMWTYIYVYNGDVSLLDIMPEGKQPFSEDHVWYAAYGSNMLKERFLKYIEGGQCRFNGKYYPPCEDPVLPLESVSVSLRHNMYYGNYDLGTWENSAVSFLDTSAPGFAFGRAYLINKDQVEHIHSLEGSGGNWYPDTVELGEMNGIRMLTFTNHCRRVSASWEQVSEKYRAVLRMGMKETYPDKGDEYIESYLESRPCF